MSLHDEIKTYINDLQALLTESHDKTLLKNAREQWGEEDGRYEVLEQFVNSPSSSKFNKPADPADIKPDKEPGNKPVKRVSGRT